MADEEDTEHQSGLLIILETRVDEVPTTSSSSVKAVPAMRGVLLLPGTGACSVRRGSETVSPPSRKGFSDGNSTRTEKNQLTVPTSSGKFHLAQANLFLGKRGPLKSSRGGPRPAEPPAGQPLEQCGLPALQIMSDKTEMNQLPLFPSGLSGHP